MKAKLRDNLTLPEGYSKRCYIGTGSEKSDQELWEDEGLTFGYNNMVYGSNDFAIYKKENWVHQLNQKKCKFKPIIVIEATDALNRGSSGDAQAQRLHHLFATVMHSIISIYYLEPGKDNWYGQMVGAMYYFSKYYQKKLGDSAVFLITSSISDIQNLINALENENELKITIENILKSMKRYFDNYLLQRYKSDWNLFFKETDYGKLKNGDFFFISAIRPPHPKSQKPPWSDSHHRAASLPFMGRYLLIGSNQFNPDINKFYFILPLFRKQYLIELNEKKKNDKEWKIFSGENHGWEVVTLDEIEGLTEDDFKLSEEIWPNNLNENPSRTKWKNFIQKIANGLIKGSLRIKIDTKKFK